MPPIPINEVLEHTRALISAAEEKLCRARLLCDVAQNTISDNADCRDLLLEARMASLSKRERRKSAKSTVQIRKRSCKSAASAS
jgi:hypothetical protein